MTTTHDTGSVAERLTDEYADVLPAGLVRSCVAAAAPQTAADALTSEALAAYIEGAARRDLDALAEAASRRPEA